MNIVNKTCRWITAICLMVAALAAAGAELPSLAGDGVRDDTAAIQARLDSGVSCVYLPPPSKEYLISKTLMIRSGQELRMDRFTRIRLSPKSDCPMLANADYDSFATNRDIAVTGGVWDYDNVNQSANFIPTLWGGKSSADYAKKYNILPCPKIFDPRYHTGVALRFRKVRGLTVRGLTVRNPVTFSVQMTDVVNFSIEGIWFDFDKWNPMRINMDGIHVDSNCHYGRIADLHGTTYDDMVALNADECWCEGPISHIDIDGIYSDYSHRGVRLLSKRPEAPISHVSIRNVHGNFWRDAVALTRYDGSRNAPRGLFEDIVIDGLSVSKCYGPNDHGIFPLLGLEGKIDVKRLVVQNFCRDEHTWDSPSITVDPLAIVREFVIRDARMINRMGAPIEFFVNRGTIERLLEENNTFEGQWLKFDRFAAPTPTDVYLLIGQSNMAGRGKLTWDNRVDTKRVVKWREDFGKWVGAEEPIISDRPFSGAGLGATFGRAMADANPSAVVGLVPAAEGGSPLQSWMPGADLYVRAVKRTRSALAHGGRLKGILWHQGCGDAGALETATNYASRLVVMVASLRRDLSARDVPFVAGELGRYLKDFRGLDPENPRPEMFWQTINEQIHKAVREIPIAAVVSSEGLGCNADLLHFDTPALRKFGFRYAKALKEIRK